MKQTGLFDGGKATIAGITGTVSEAAIDELPDVVTEHNIERCLAIAESTVTGTFTTPAKLVEQLKENEEDFEWYPTTTEIIHKVCRCIGIRRRNEHGNWEGGSTSSFMDIGAGNGKVLKAVKEHCGLTQLYAIEKSSILCREIPEDVLIVGTTFEEQSLLSKDVDITFCNPPYSKYEAWAEKIIRESNSRTVFLVIPERWQSSDPIQDALRFRSVKATKVGEYDFANAERKARCHVHLLRIDFDKSRDEKDPFTLWFEEQFAVLIESTKGDKPKCKCGYEFPEVKKGGNYYCPECADFSDGKGGTRDRPFDTLVVGPNYPEALVNLYNAEMAKIQNNYQLVGQLDREVMRELEVTPAKIMACLRERMKGLKNDYWQELFSHLDTITSRLTSKSRRSLLETLQKHVSVDFTLSNILEVVIWVIRNANSYIDRQLIETYDLMVGKCNVQLYKSNKRVWQDNEWRYSERPERMSHFKLDYRIVTHRPGGCRSGYSFERGLTENTAQFLGDLLTIANNLGFFNDTTAVAGKHDRQNWKSGEKYEFYRKASYEVGDTVDGLGIVDAKFKMQDGSWQYQIEGEFYHERGINGEVLFEVRAFLNGNVHLRIAQDFMLALNVEHGRLRGWIHNAKEAVEELGDKNAAKYFDTNLKLGAANLPMLCAPKS